MSVRTLKAVFVLVDVGFIVYWISAWLQLFPQDYLFKDYDNPILQAWNFSFLPLDLFVSATGLSAVWCHSRGKPQWRSLALVSLTLTSCSGLQAVSFWALRGDYDLTWWVPNLFLLLYPGFFIPAIMREGREHGATGIAPTTVSHSPARSANRSTAWWCRTS